VAEGISEALVTTETGLIIALPGLFFQYQLSRQLERYKAFLAHLEAICTQKQYRTLSRQEQERTTATPQRAPLRPAAARLRLEHLRQQRQEALRDEANAPEKREMVA
jgi:hypothetical protein